MLIDFFRGLDQRFHAFALVPEEGFVNVHLVFDTQLVQCLFHLILYRHRPYLRGHAHVDVNRADAGKVVRPIGRSAFDAADIDLGVQRAGRGFINIFFFELCRPFLQRGDNLGHLDDGVHLLHRMSRALGAPSRFGFTESRDLDLHDSVLGPNDIEIRTVGDNGVIGVHAVCQ